MNTNDSIKQLERTAFETRLVVDKLLEKTEAHDKQLQEIKSTQQQLLAKQKIDDEIKHWIKNNWVSIVTCVVVAFDKAYPYLLTHHQTLIK